MGLLDDTTQQQYYQGNDFGNYQFISLEDIINQFIVAYVGDGKIIPKIKRTDVAFHAQRALAELSFDTLKSCKAQEITVPASLQMILPQDYVNYTKVSWVDSAGIKHLMYPTNKTSNPTNLLQDDDGEYKITAVGTFTATSNAVVLDGEYPNITPGMLVEVPNPDVITGSVAVYRTTVDNGITTIELITFFGAANAALSGDYTLTFKSLSTSIDNLILEKDTSLHLENLSWDVNDHIITQSPNTDVSNIEVGMRVYGPTNLFGPDPAFVTSVNGAVITVSLPMLIASTALTNGGELRFMSISGDSQTWSNYKSATPSENQDDYQDDTYWPMDGERYGLDPQYAQANGSFYIDCISGKIHFSSNVSGKTVVLDYISDSLGTDGEMQVHKFAEDAMYKWISHAILSASSYGQPLVTRLTKEKFAAVRKAKLRLSNIKLEELTQILRGKSKQIKH